MAMRKNLKTKRLANSHSLAKLCHDELKQVVGGSEERVIQHRDLIDTLRIAQEISSKGYLISSSELADLMDIDA